MFSITKNNRKGVKQTIMKRYVYITVLLLAIVLFSGCSANLPTDEGVRVYEIYSIGERAEYGSLALTVRGIRTEYTRENEGLLIIDCLVENSGAHEIALSVPAMFALFDSNHHSADLSLLADTKGDLNAVIAPGRKIAGEIAFIIDKELPGWDFVFAPRSFGLNEVVFRINETDLQAR